MRWSRTAVMAGMIVGVALACSKDGNRETKEVTAYDQTSPVTANAGSIGSGGGGAGGIGGVGMQSAPAPVAPPRVRGEGSVGDVSSELASTTVAEPSMPTQSQSSLPVDATAPMIIRTGNATIQVDQLEPAVGKLRTLAQSLGGYVGNTSMQTGSDQVRSASVEIKIPARRWGELLIGLNPIGKREALTESAQDVGEEFVDVSARVANARRLEERLISLLANRTGKLSDALSVERELARVREEIERYEGRLRYLRSQAAISTMIVFVHEPPPVLGTQPGSNPIADAFRAAWRNFVGFVAGLIAFLGVLVPVVLVAVLIWWLIRRFRPLPPSKS